MTLADALDTMRIPRVAGRTGARTAVVTTRPLRAPPHTISDVGLIGGGQVPRPGEVSRAHHGILFLDELPEFRRHVLEVLRQPLDHGSRTSSSAPFVRTIAPRVAVFSVQRDNRFGHPHPVVLDRYTALGTHVLRTDEHGALPSVPMANRCGWSPLSASQWSSHQLECTNWWKPRRRRLRPHPVSAALHREGGLHGLQDQEWDRPVSSPSGVAPRGRRPHIFSTLDYQQTGKNILTTC
jgi:hypothetical protein